MAVPPGTMVTAGSASMAWSYRKSSAATSRKIKRAVVSTDERKLFRTDLLLADHGRFGRIVSLPGTILASHSYGRQVFCVLGTRAYHTYCPIEPARCVPAEWPTAM